MCNQYIISFLFTVRLIEFGAFLKIIGLKSKINISFALPFVLDVVLYSTILACCSSCPDI